MISYVAIHGLPTVCEKKRSITLTNEGPPIVYIISQTEVSFLLRSGILMHWIIQWSKKERISERIPPKQLER